VLRPPGEDAVLAVHCLSLDASELFTQKSSIVMEALPDGIHTDDTDTDASIVSALGALGDEAAQGSCFSVFSVAEGTRRPVRAVGLGSNVKKRTRAARLALAVALELAERWGVPPDLEPVVLQAERALAQPPQARQFPRADPHPAFTALGYQDSDPGMAGPPATRAQRAAEVDPDAPRECVRDPAAELRPWSNQILWPYCTACGCWSDLSHLHGQRHKKALRMLEWSQSGAWPQTSGSGSALPPASTNVGGGASLHRPEQATQARGMRQTSSSWLEAGGLPVHAENLDIPPPPPGQPSTDQRNPPPPPPPHHFFHAPQQSGLPYGSAPYTLDHLASSAAYAAASACREAMGGSTRDSVLGPAPHVGSSHRGNAMPVTPGSRGPTASEVPLPVPRWCSTDVDMAACWNSDGTIEV